MTRTFTIPWITVFWFVMFLLGCNLLAVIIYAPATKADLEQLPAMTVFYGRTWINPQALDQDYSDGQGSELLHWNQADWQGLIEYLQYESLEHNLDSARVLLFFGGTQ